MQRTIQSNLKDMAELIGKCGERKVGTDDPAKQVGRNERAYPCEPIGCSPRLYVRATTLAKTVSMPKDFCRLAWRLRL